MGKDPNAPSAEVAAQHDNQFLLENDNATLGSAYAHAHYNRTWLKVEDLR